MPRPFRLLIAYDGSPCATDMLDDLLAAGLPDRGEASVVSVAERWLPPPSLYELATEHLPSRGVRSARMLAEAAAAAVRARLGNWTVHAEAEVGSPAKTILRKARDWDADLIVAGSFGHSPLARMLIGSVSYKIANEASCSVRIIRPAKDAATNRLLIAYDARPASELAVRAVASRNWAKGMHARIAMAIGYGPAPAGEFHLPEGLGRAGAVIQTASSALEAAGLEVSSVVREGDPKHVLVELAAEWGPDCIVVGDNDEWVLDRVVLGTVAAALLARAPCTVEIVR